MFVTNKNIKKIHYSSSSVIKVAKSVIKSEEEALLHLRESISVTFDKAVQLLSEISGRVVLSGIGKSGHVARKIASTLSSVGTSAFFLHPSEASHGDLGMLQKNDAAVVLSNSGNTAELEALLDFLASQKIPLIAITSNKHSTLAKAAQVVLELPQLKEACPFNLAPTISTVMMMALGDALAMALLQVKNFTQQDYKILHPGGNLGYLLRPVSQVMSKAPLVKQDTLMSEAVVVMTKYAKGCVGVLDDEGSKVIGVITDGDLRRHMSKNILEQPVCEVMSRNPKSVIETITLQHALELMEENKITVLFVLPSKKEDPGHDNSMQNFCDSIGIIHIHDLLKECYIIN